MLDLSKMELPAPESDTEGLDLSGEKGMESESPAVDLSKVSDDELLKEVEARGLIEPEEAAEPMEDEEASEPLDGLVQIKAG